MTEKGRLSKVISAITEETSALLPGESLIELYSNRRVLIEYHKGIVSYGTCRICVKVKNGEICICGEDLSVAQMTQDRMTISGIVDEIRFCRGG